MAKKNTKKNRKPVMVDVRPYIRRILQHTNQDTHTWKNNWNSDRVAKKYGLRKFQVAAVLAHSKMGRYAR